MKLRRPLLPGAAIVAMIAVAASCGRSGPREGSGEPTGTPELEFGDGRDGDLDVDTNTAITDCRQLVDVSGTTVTLASALVLAQGDHLLLLQVTDETSETVGDTSPVSDLGDAGRWEIVSVVLASSADVQVSDAPASFFGSSGARRAQACHVPQFTDVRVRDDRFLTPTAAWNGNAGGVIAFRVAGTLRIDVDGVVLADGNGSRGGMPNLNGDGTTNVTSESTSFDQGGGKGEGIDGGGFGVLWGRGNLANAAGGGNSRNGGGGGGGNGGRGGFGGSQEANGGGTYNEETRGRGGVEIPLAANPFTRLLFGGGGGAGQWETVGGIHPSGGAGGGIVLVYARSIEGSGTIRSCGAPGGMSDVDGSSGGGAGGTIALVAPTSGAFAGSVIACGGAGGNSPTPGPGGERPPGGGGGGGRILLGPAALASDGSFVVDGGRQGFLDNGNGATSWGATNGSAGVIAF